jgi:hypothetical protein
MRADLSREARLAEALRLADVGPDGMGPLSIFPCRHDKTPAISKSRGGNGHKDATTDSHRIKAWWGEYPYALIGVAAGERFVVVDCDLQHASAAQWYRQAQADMPPTRTHTTMSGGRHLLFKPHPVVNCTTSKLHKNIDTRGNGGYIIWWPCERLEVTNGATLADVPEWIVEKLNHIPERPRSRTNSRPSAGAPLSGLTAIRALHKLEAIVGTIANAKEGERNSLLFWGALRLAEMAFHSLITPDDAFAFAAEAARQAGLSATEATRTIKSAFSREIKDDFQF